MRYFNLVLAIGSAGLIQGCGDVAFNQSESSGVKMTCADASCGLKSVSEISDNDFNSAPNDILFVIDDSVSMNAIFTNIRAGFASLKNATFPADTRMAVTYMSPQVVGANGSVDLTRAWFAKAQGTPGHLQLVSAASIHNFVSTVNDGNEGDFVHAGCADEWFAPNAVDANGDRCLDGAIQSPFYGTGVEAGVVSLSHLLMKKSADGQRLFRTGAFAHIIFVSDTHEPGATYWGTANAPARQMTLAEIQTAINNNSPGVASLKFSGVLPVPKVGSPLLTGLRVSGPIPQTDAEAYVDAENGTANVGGLWWDYSYIPFIKGTGGAIAHPKLNDWSALASDLMTDSNFTGNLLVNLSHKVDTLDSVEVAGVPIDPSQVTLSSDGLSLSIRYVSYSNAKLRIKVLYHSRE